ncbi:MAG: QWxxN domain [Enterococcus sp.]
MKGVPETVVDSDLEPVHTIVMDVTENVVPATRYSEPLPIFYYHLLLFQKRNETSAVNKKLQEFFTKEGIAIKKNSSSDLEKAILQWLEKESTKGDSDISERKQFLAYFLLKAYGVKDLRLGEFLSSTKVQAIFNQWKANTLLEGYTYQEITYTTIHHQLSQAEAPSMIHLKEQKKESQQIYADFIHDRTPTISKDQPNQTIYYHRTLFEKRMATLAVNEAVRKFLLEQKVSFKDPSASELVREMQKWLFEGTNYGTILAREKQIAQILQKAYGLEEKEVTVKEARYLLLQWENNNAQVGYTYKDTSTFEAIEISAVEANEEEKERIEAFIRENKENRFTEVTNESKEEPLSEWTKEQKEELLKKIVAFLGEKSIEVDVSKPNELVVKTARWATKEVEGKETTDFTKVKMLANIILGKKEDAVISKEKAQAIFTKWLLDTSEEEAPTFTSTELIKEETTQTTQTTQAAEITTMQPSASGKQTPKYEAPNWRDKNMRIQVAQFFRQEGILKEGSTTENILLAMGKWFTEERGEMILSYNKLQSLSKVILKELDLYGGEGNETISDKDARLTIMKWVTENILGSSMEGYMLKKILDSPNPSEFTIGNLRKLFETEALINFSTFRVSKEELTIVQKLWSLFLKEVLPNYFLETSALADELPISNYDSLMQLTGAKLLADLDIHTQFNQAEIQTFGTFIWDKISKYGIKKVEELRYTVLPALLAIAQLEPDLLRKALEKGDYQEVALSTLIEYHQNGYLQLKEHQDTLYDLFTAYQKEVLNWRRKQALAKEVVQTYLQHAKGKALFPAFVLEQDYLLGKSLSINDYTSPDLGEWYKRLTKAVSDSFYPLDQKLIESALAAVDPEEREFIFSLETELYEASAQLEHTQVTPFTSSFPVVLLTQLQLEQTDLFVAVQGEKERWYALKKLDKDGGYVFYRVDKNPLAYLKYGLLNQKNIWGQGYKKVGNSIQIGKQYFTFITHIDRSKKLSQGEERQPLIDAFSRKHSDKLYDELYKSGNDKAILEQIWDVAKHLIPFYDCVTASIDKDVATAVPACTIDIVLLIPVFGQVTALSTKFAFGMAKAMATGGIRNAIRQGARFTPKISEVKSVLANIGRYLDPGITTITDGSKFVCKELVALKNKIWVKKNVKQLLGKIDGLVKETPTLPKDVIRTYLPGKSLEIYAKRMENGSYRLVSDLKTGDVYGNPFWLRGNRLERFTEPVTFTEEQIALINRLAKEIDSDQIFVTVPNLNPNAYGNGEVMSVSEVGKATKYFITINGHTVPVRVIPIEGRGVRYDVIDGENIYRVNFNGREWYFDEMPFPFVLKESADEVIKNIDEFESIKDSSALSAPDERGLRWNSLGRSYIKIYDHYIPLIQLYKGWDWYHLVKKDANQPMTLWVFDPAIEQFRFETSLEKELREERLGQKKTWLSKAVSILKGKEGELPPYGTLPDPPGRGAEWNEFRNTIDVEVETLPPIKEEDHTVRMDPLTKFLPEPRMLVYNNEAYNEGKILDTIIEDLPKDPPLKFRVYRGLDLSKTPDFLQSFVIELAEDYKIAQERFQKALEVLQEVLTKEKIAGTPQGQYLIQMFSLEKVRNPEPILLEAVNRLISVSKKGAKFLQKTADWGYENILIASSDLIKLPGIRKYRSTSSEYIGSMAFVFPYDPECRITILADSYHLNPVLNRGLEMNPEKSRTFIHETSHLVSTAVDLVVYSRNKLGIRKSGEVLLEEYKKQSYKIYSSKGFKMFVNSIIIYQNKPGLSLATVWQETIKSDLFRVNLQLSDAEMVTLIIRDFADGRDFNGVLRETRSLKDSIIEDESIFIFLAVAANTYTYGNFEKAPELANEQEQTTDNPDLTEAVTNENNHSTIGKREKREIASNHMELTEDSSNRSFLELKSMSPENSNMIGLSSSNQQIDTEFSKTTEKKSFLNIVATSIERSTRINPRMDLNQPISKNIPQH